MDDMVTGDQSTTSETGSSMPSPTEGAESTGSGKRGKKPVRRKPIWLAIPIEFKDVVGNDGEFVKEPSKYELFECNGKPEVAKILSERQKSGAIDGTNVHHVRAFRADPLPLQMSTQVAIKF